MPRPSAACNANVPFVWMAAGGYQYSRFLSLVAAGDFRGAINLIKETTPCGSNRPGIPQEEQCEGVCTMRKRFEPVGLAAWNALSPIGGRARRLVHPDCLRRPGRRWRLSVLDGRHYSAADLVKKAISHHLRALHEAGGVLVYGIPEFVAQGHCPAGDRYVCSMGVNWSRICRRHLGHG